MGREQEHAELRALVAKSRVVFVYGPAGVGKTSLVLDVCHAAAREGVAPPVVHVSVPGQVTAREAVERTAKAIGQRPADARRDDALSVLLSNAPHTVVWDDIDEKATGLGIAGEIVAEAARAAGATRLTGRYVPTAKNGLVERHFDKLGFTAAGEEADGTTLWELPLDAYAAPTLPLIVTRG